MKRRPLRMRGSGQWRNAGVFVFAGSALVWFVRCVAMPYWRKIGATPEQCLLGNPACFSAAFSGVSSLFALGAAVGAWATADYARKTLEHERSVILSVQTCSETHEGRRVEAYLDDVAVGFMLGAPPSSGRQAYRPFDVELINVGRSPIVNGNLHVVAINRSGERFFLQVDIGCVRADQACHLRLLFHPAIASMTFRWSHATHKEGTDGEEAIDVHWRSPAIVPASTTLLEQRVERSSGGGELMLRKELNPRNDAANEG